jgi:hypothetical protein
MQIHSKIAISKALFCVGCSILFSFFFQKKYMSVPFKRRYLITEQPSLLFPFSSLFPSPFNPLFREDLVDC